jgi:hypothetical protein
MERKQKYMKEIEICQPGTTVIDPVTTMRQKALFLLKFAGLSKGHLQLQVTLLNVTTFVLI